MRLTTIIERSRGVIGGQPRTTVFSMAALALACFLATAAIVLWISLLDMRGRMQEQLAILAFLKRDLTEEELKMAKLNIKAWPEVYNVSYKTANQSLDAFLHSFPEETKALAELETNPLTAVIEVYPKHGLSRARLEQVKKRLEAFSYVEQVESGQLWIDRLESVLNLFEAAALLFSVTIAAAVLLIVMNTVRVFVSFYADEIRLLELLGERRSHSVAPFINAGFAVGICGGLTGSATFIALANALSIYVTISPLVGLYAGLAVVSFTAMMSFFGASIAVRRAKG